MDNKFSNIKKRILQYTDYKGITKELFFKSIGMSYASFKGSAKERPLNSDAIENILTLHSEINSEWLLTGKGEMLKQKPSDKIINDNYKTSDRIIDVQEIPLHNLEAVVKLAELFKSNRLAETFEIIKISNIPPCDGVLPVSGDSMYPLLKSGDLVLYKKIPVEINSIFWGEMYLLSIQIGEQDEEVITVKYVQKSDLGPEYVKLVSQNHHHQPKDFLLKQITAMALVKVSICVNTIF